MSAPEGYREPMNPFKPHTQLYRLLEYFAAHPMEWITMPRLSDVYGSYVIHSKVAELRRLRIGEFENRLEHHGWHVVASLYRFIPFGFEP